MNRLSAKSVDYMELHGAKKDGDCAKVEVRGGISKSLGCCNAFKPKQGAQQFKCGQCVYARNMTRLKYAW